MSRKAKPQQAESHDRWLVSYSDFITLMFAFFVVMFASSQTDKARAKQVSDSVQKALEEGRVAPAIAALLGGTVDDKGKGNAMQRGPGGINKPSPSPNDKAKFQQELLPSLNYLSQQLKQEISAGKLQVHMEGRGLVVSLREAAFFPSGEDTVALEAYGSIEKISVAINSLPNPVRLEGHTDSVPIHNSRFQSNWQLSAARSIAMLELFKNRFRVAEPRLAVAGYADTSPIDTNDTEEGRAHNRRVDIVILSKKGYEKVEPGAAEPQKPATGSGARATAAMPAAPPPKPAPQPAVHSAGAFAPPPARQTAAPGHQPAATQAVRIVEHPAATTSVPGKTGPTLVKPSPAGAPRTPTASQIQEALAKRAQVLPTASTKTAR